MRIYEQDGRYYAEPTEKDWLTDWQGVFSKQMCAPKAECFDNLEECYDSEKEHWEKDNLPPRPEREHSPEVEPEPSES